MKNKILMISAVILMGVLFSGCVDLVSLYFPTYGSNNNETEDAIEDFGITMDVEKLIEKGANVLKIELVNTKNSSNKYEKTVTLTSNSLVIKFEEILVGTYSVNIVVYNDQNEIIGNGSGSIEIKSNDTSNTTVDITLDPPEEETGNANIYINISEGNSTSSNNKKSLFIGINNYTHQQSLSYTDDDASDLYNVLNRITDVENNKLTGSVYKDDVENQIRNLSGNSLFIFTYSGHGIYSGGVSKIAFSNYYSGSPDEYLSATELKQYMDSLNGPVLIIIDACESGDFVRNETQKEILEKFTNDFVNVFNNNSRSANPYLVIAGSSIYEYSYESGTLRNGILSFTISDALGMPDETNPTGSFNSSYDADKNGDRKITFGELIDYVDAQVNYLSEGDQTIRYTQNQDNYLLFQY